MPGTFEAVAGEVARGPIEVGLGEIDAGGLERAAGGRVDADAAGVAEQVEKALAARQLAHARARRPVVEEQAGVEVVPQVDVEHKAALADLEEFAAFVEPPVLATALAALAGLCGDALARHAERFAGGAHRFAPSRAGEVLVDAGWSLIFLDVQPEVAADGTIEVDRARVF